MKYCLITAKNCQNIPADPFSFQRFFFNEPPHLQHQAEENLFSFFLKNIDNQLIEARFSVIVKDFVAYSPLKATFGGIEFNPSLTIDELRYFLNEILIFLKNKRVKEIIINHYPERYLTLYQKQILDTCLAFFDFQVKYTEHNYEIKISKKSFLETVSSARARQLVRKGIKEGFVFKEETQIDFPAIHDFIAQARLRKGRPMTMTLEQLEAHFEKFPENFQLFSVSSQNNLLAVAVIIVLNPQIAYTFYLADDSAYLRFSPTTFLLSGIYENFKEKFFEILDLGIATDKGILNQGLARFKRSLGGELSYKKTYFLKL
ncbi:MAG: hypothetical protein MUF58_22475 [Arcicella sp.]|nr:hypothetical protein [Arcicella sp.]